ncbi:hypothetical protein D0B54_00585 [Solimonas sp. K1W22B-7]|uniref:hypothetical protein n=1 Tax=Solimonas sp. K1W22B-7 TaxID=2303331 RepID=UPI000E330EC7|nr:hypothetical protein [Solimonas sp. K1W22B-7]AXQ27275.1 hypothetical protein D0B54_00585 [Solimonas sp. K1W22B-7]
MSTNDEQKQKNTVLVVLSVLGIALMLTWAVATLFEISVIKSLAAVILVLFGILIAMLMTGIG